MRVLIVVPQQDRISGNWVTALRFQDGLARRGCVVEIIAVAPGDAQRLAAQADAFKPDVALLLHAYRAGQPWRDSLVALPFIVMLTGTDQNQGLTDQAQQDTIRGILRDAAFIVIQNPLLADDLAKTCPEFAGKVRTPSPGITLGSTDYDLYETHQLSREHPIFLCPAGLRPVKGVLELVKLFDAHAASAPPFQLAVCGPVLDPGYGKECLALIAEKPWAHYLGTVPADAMASAMRQADVIMNNSFAEGLSNTLLEAVALGRPILARHIPGNAAIVEHGVNGFMYRDDEEFAVHFSALLKPGIRRQLSRATPEKFLPEHEANELFGLLEQAKQVKG